MTNRGIYLWIAVLALAFAGLAVSCARLENTANVNANAGVVTPTGAVTSSEAGKTKPAFRAEFATAPEEVRAGERAEFILTVKDAKGNTVRELSTVHEKPMHLLVVSDDLAEFYHLHPEPQPDGSHRTAFTFASGGAYKLYADFTPPGGAQVVDRHDLKVSGSARPRVALLEDTSLAKTVESLRVTLEPEKPLRAGQELMLNFAVVDARTRKPVTDLEPYLGSLAHFVIISEDTTDFLHAHPMERGEQMAGMNAPGGEDHGAVPHAHGADAAAGG